MPFLKPQKVRLYWNFAPLFSVMEDTSSVFFFSSNLIYLGQKYPIEVKFLDFLVVGWTFTQFLMSCLKRQVSCSLNFALLSSVRRNNSSVHFYLYLYIIWQKEHITVQISRLSAAHTKNGKISCVIFQTTCHFSCWLFPSLFSVMNNSSVFL